MLTLRPSSAALAAAAMPAGPAPIMTRSRRIIMRLRLMRPVDPQPWGYLGHAGLPHHAVDLDKAVVTGTHHAERRARRARDLGVPEHLHARGQQGGGQVRALAQQERRPVKTDFYARTAVIGFKKRRSGLH